MNSGLFMPFDYTKAVTYTVENVGGGIAQDPATKVTHLGLNQPPVFSSDIWLSASHAGIL